MAEIITDDDWRYGMDDDVDQSTDQSTDDAGADDADASREEPEVDEVDPRLKPLNEQNEALQAQLRKAHEEIELERKTAEFRALPGDQRHVWLEKTFRNASTLRDEFAEHVAQVERAERVEQILSLTGDARIEAVRRTDDLTLAAVEATLEKAGDEDGLREVRSRLNETVVELAPSEVIEDGTESQPRDYVAEWHEGPLAEMTPDVGKYVEGLVARIDRGEIRLDSAASQELETLRSDPALQYPDGHSHKVRALEAIAGFTSWAESEYNASLPWPQGGIKVSQSYTRPDGTQWLRETDGRGTVRESPVEGGMAPSELGLISDPRRPFDPSSVETLEDIRGLAGDQLALIPVEKREELYRQEAEARKQEAEEAEKLKLIQ
jgi:hypothetical protein